jgi:dephospho-CoA kinase
MPGCGKEEFLRVARERGLAVVRMGDVVRDEVRRRKRPLTDQAVGSLAQEERQKHGYGVWAERTVPHVGEGPTVVDGVRGRAELEVFRKAFGEGLRVVAIHASPRTRFERIRGRQRGDDVVSWEQFLRRDEREMGWGLAEVIATAEYMIVNEDDLASLESQAKAVLDAVLEDA